MDAEEANQTLQDEHAALSEQHAANTQRIAELETQNAELRRASTRVQTITVPDPEHAEIRRENETLHKAVFFLAKQIDRPEETAIRAIREVPEFADKICAGLGINHNEYRQYLMTYKTERDLLQVIEQAQVTDTPFLRFVRATLSVIHGANISGPRRRESVPMDPVTAAKYLTGTLKPVDGDF
jgi:DNA repair exonuclease SbcCD ATPase subunit